ncbi:MAG TPA: PPC domain-containing protein [Patescibacteria group bacterium]|nr:PPC domain-containing protein [Patescibacteria group bacterium]
MAGTRDARADLRREVEPNDLSTTAQPLLAPVSVGGLIGAPGDRDWYAVRVRPGATLDASVLARGFRADTSPGSPLTARLSILASDGVSLLAQDDSQGGFDDPVTSAPFQQGGVLYVTVEDLDSLGGPDYRYVLTIEEEGNGTFAGATPLRPPVLASIDSLIMPAGDHDFYRFDATAGQTASVDFDSAVFNPNVPAVKGVVTLYAPDQSVLASAAYSAGNPVDPYLSVVLPSSGTYYVDVHDLRGFVGGPTSLYQLSIELGPAASNDVAATAEPIAPARGLSGTLCPAGDRDDARLTLASAATLAADLDAREDLQSLLTGRVSILDGAGNLVASDASTPDPQVAAPRPAGDSVVTVEGASSGLCEDAYWELYVDGDADGDGLRLPSDDCAGVFNPGQEDRDGDGVGDACDDCIAVFNPGQETPLRGQAPVGDTLAVASDPSGALLTWTPAPGSVASNVYRVLSAASGTQPSYVCRADNVMTTSFIDSDRPPQGSVFFYVVSGENCGESGAGADSSGEPILVTPCPAPI